jgi:hypothetical protein
LREGLLLGLNQEVTSRDAADRIGQFRKSGINYKPAVNAGEHLAKLPAAGAKIGDGANASRNLTRLEWRMEKNQL